MTKPHTLNNIGSVEVKLHMLYTSITVATFQSLAERGFQDLGESLDALAEKKFLVTFHILYLISVLVQFICIYK
jgi:hypothetical protein